MHIYNIYIYYTYILYIYIICIYIYLQDNLVSLLFIKERSITIYIYRWKQQNNYVCEK